MSGNEEKTLQQELDFLKSTNDDLRRALAVAEHERRTVAPCVVVCDLLTVDLGYRHGESSVRMDTAILTAS